ncbi:unnamed protein product, partial [Effrenium voratum]
TALAACLTYSLRRRQKVPDLQGLLALSADDVLSVADAPFRHFVNRSLQDSPPVEDYDISASVGVAVCVVDSGQGLFQLGQGLMAFNAAASACRPPPEEFSDASQQACAASASYGLAGVFWSACFISLAVSDCAGTFNTRAGCAADMTSLMGTTSYLSSAISSMLLNCHGAVGLEELKVQEMGGRRLAHRRLDWKTSEAYNISQKVKVLEANQAARSAAHAACFFDVGHTAFWLARVGTSVAQEIRTSGGGRAPDGA